MDRKSIPRADRAASLLSSLITLLACAGPWCRCTCWGGPRCRLRGLGRGGALAAGARGEPISARRRYRLSLALDLGPGPGRLGRGQTGRRRRYPGLRLRLCLRLVLAFGTFFTLAFLPVGLIVGLVIVLAPSLRLARKAGLILAVGRGVPALTALGWSYGGQPNDRLELEPQESRPVLRGIPQDLSRLAGVNPIELAVAFGLPAVVWCALGLLGPVPFPSSPGPHSGSLSS